MSYYPAQNNFNYDFLPPVSADAMSNMDATFPAMDNSANADPNFGFLPSTGYQSFSPQPDGAGHICAKGDYSNQYGYTPTSHPAPAPEAAPQMGYQAVSHASGRDSFPGMCAVTITLHTLLTMTSQTTRRNGRADIREHWRLSRLSAQLEVATSIISPVSTKSNVR